MLYRARKPQTAWVEALGREVYLDPAVPIDDEDPEGAAIVAEWGHRRILRRDAVVEQATAAPGEQRGAA